MAWGAREGHVVVLDGIHRLPKGALVSSLGRLTDGELDLPDGSRLQAAAEFQLLALAEPGAVTRCGGAI